MKEFLIGAAAIVVAGAAFAQAQAPTPQPVSQAPVPHAAPPLTERIDTRDEMVAKVREHFAQLDANRDGFLTKEEADAGRKLFRERIRERLGDRRDPGQAFDRLDTNKDGSVSRDEFTKGREERIERRMVVKDGQPMPGGPGASPAPNAHRGFRMHRMGMIGGHMFELADANKDSRVSLQEATDAAVRHFDRADANRDGRITPEERRQMRRQYIEKRRAPKAG